MTPALTTLAHDLAIVRKTVEQLARKTDDELAFARKQVDAAHGRAQQLLELRTSLRMLGQQLAQELRRVPPAPAPSERVHAEEPT